MNNSNFEILKLPVGMFSCQLLRQSDGFLFDHVIPTVSKIKDIAHESDKYLSQTKILIFKILNFKNYKIWIFLRFAKWTCDGCGLGEIAASRIGYYRNGLIDGVFNGFVDTNSSLAMVIGRATGRLQWFGGFFGKVSHGKFRILKIWFSGFTSFQWTRKCQTSRFVGSGRAGQLVRRSTTQIH